MRLAQLIWKRYAQPEDPANSNLLRGLRRQLGWLLESQRAKRATERAVADLDLADFSVQRAHERAINILTVLRDALAEHGPLLAAGALTHLPWRKRAR
jgi:hypothetical protein